MGNRAVAMVTALMNSAAVGTCAITARDEASSNAGRDGVNELQALPPTEELMAMDCCWGRENHSLLRTWPLVNLPHSGMYE